MSDLRRDFEGNGKDWTAPRVVDEPRVKTYSINECFYSPQGEGHRSGTMNVFLRFAGCNLQCVDAKKLDRPLQGNEIDAGFHCDTDFAKVQKLTLEEVIDLVKKTDKGGCGWVILTGGEPTLQADSALIRALRRARYYIAIETNGTRWADILDEGDDPVDFVSCSPKPGSKIELDEASEVRCVAKAGQIPNDGGIKARHYFVSPACDAPTADKITGFHGSVADFNREAMAWAVEYCSAHPKWRVSLQIHKILNVR